MKKFKKFSLIFIIFVATILIVFTVPNLKNYNYVVAHCNLPFVIFGVETVERNTLFILTHFTKKQIQVEYQFLQENLKSKATKKYEMWMRISALPTLSQEESEKYREKALDALTALTYKKLHNNQ